MVSYPQRPSASHSWSVTVSDQTVLLYSVECIGPFSQPGSTTSPLQVPKRSLGRTTFGSGVGEAVAEPVVAEALVDARGDVPSACSLSSVSPPHEASTSAKIARRTVLRIFLTPSE